MSEVRSGFIFFFFLNKNNVLCSFIFTSNNGLYVENPAPSNQNMQSAFYSIVFNCPSTVSSCLWGWGGGVVGGGYCASRLHFELRSLSSSLKVVLY